MSRIAVLVPGMMGSVLEQKDFYRGTQTLWGENLNENYRTLIQNPGLLKWADNPAEARMLHSVRLDAEIPWLRLNVGSRKLDIWNRIWNFLNARTDLTGILEFGYDWRAPLIDSSKKLAEFLASYTGVDLSKPKLDENVGIIMLAHSMGGLVVRICIAKELIHASWIDRIIDIGTPLRGSPSAFRTAYESLGLPLFREIFSLMTGKNKAAFEAHLLECIRSFPSLYHLLPPKDVLYLYYSQSSRSNPLREKAMAADKRLLATECHEMMSLAQRIIVRDQIKSFTIYTELHATMPTELEYRVKPFAQGRGYSITAVHAHTSYGDGTVPSDSARGEAYTKGLSVTNVGHMSLCNDDKVVQCLGALL